MYPMSQRRKRPEDIVAEAGGMTGDPSAAAAPVGDESAMDPLAAMVPPSGQEPQVAALLNPQGGGAPTDSPTFGQDLSAGITNPGDAALESGLLGDQDPAEMQAEQMAQTLDNPEADPQERNLIAQQLQLAARRRMARL